MLSISDQYILLRDGLKLGYADYGDPQGKPVFLFHGIPGSLMMQHPDASIAIAGNVRLIVPERPGMSLSDFKPGRTLLDWPSDVEELADALGIAEFTVAGFSPGVISGVGPTNIPGVLKGMLSSNRMGYSVGC